MTIEKIVLQTQLVAIENDMDAAHAALEQWQNQVIKLHNSKIMVVKKLEELKI